jgi:hypothetical protein
MNYDSLIEPRYKVFVLCCVTVALNVVIVVCFNAFGGLQEGYDGDSKTATLRRRTWMQVLYTSTYNVRT